jgi:pyridoxal phosphate enzyme (YggS family)
MTLAARLAEVEARLVRACAASGRGRDSVLLVAVSKTHPSNAIREAYALGIRDFGESYAQELAVKARELQDLPDLRFHFIGHLQSNKAKLIAEHVHLVHTVDSASLARELAKRATAQGRVLPVLLEVNVGGEAQKHGCAPADLPALFAAASAEASLQVRGLMTIPPDDPALAKQAFEDLALLRKTHGEALLPELSMGMSGDLELAVAAGATMVRIGTAIFGPRE